MNTRTSIALLALALLGADVPLARAFPPPDGGSTCAVVLDEVWDAIEAGNELVDKLEWEFEHDSSGFEPIVAKYRNDLATALTELENAMGADSGVIPAIEVVADVLTKIHADERITPLNRQEASSIGQMLDDAKLAYGGICRSNHARSRSAAITQGFGPCAAGGLTRSGPADMGER